MTKLLSQKLVLGLMLFMPLFAWAQTNTANISGTVYFAEFGIPFPEFPIEVTTSNGFSTVVLTDELGEYSIDIDVPAGEALVVDLAFTDFCTGEVESFALDVVGGLEVEVDVFICDDITPPPPPEGCQAHFWYEQDYFQEFGVFFHDLSSTEAPVDTWFWEFGDGETSEEQNPFHLYEEPGVYTVTLTITADTCTSTIVQEIFVEDFVFEDCEASFFYFSTTYLNVQFIDVSWAAEPIVSWAWDFGDGGTSTEQEPIHVYAEPGVYPVSLTITTADSCESTLSYEVFVEDVVQTECEAFFFYDYVDEYEIQFFDFSYTTTPINTWSWDFGDGETSNEEDPLHTYAEAGEYEVTLTIETDSCTSTYTEIVWVDFYTQPDCQAFFFFFQIDSTTFEFIDLSSTFGTTVDEWFWDFGDGNTSTEQNPVHTYDESGEYVVTLTIVSDSCESTIMQDVFTDPIICCHEPEECSALFDYTFGPTGSEFELQFHDASYAEGDILTWDWDFGDGNTSTEQNPIHTYDEPGIYDVSLTISTSDTCESTFVLHICIGEGGVQEMPDCQAFFFPEQDPNDLMTFTFVNFSMGEDLEYEWDFGDGNTSTEVSPTHTYSEEGIFQVNLTVSNDSCSNTMGMIIFTDPEVFYNSECSAVFLPLFTVDNQEVFFLNFSSPDAVEFAWDFGDGNTSEEPFPVHVYDQVGTYTATLTIVTVDGCTNTFAVTFDLGGDNLMTGDMSLSAIILSTENNQIADTEVQLFPNPAKDQLNVVLDGVSRGVVNYEIINAVGQVVQRVQAGADEAQTKILAIDNLPTGWYVLRIQADGFSATKKFSKLN